jgi:hypothetical protein
MATQARGHGSGSHHPRLRSTERVCQVVISGLGGAVDVSVQPDCITQAGLHIPDVVVILIRSTGHHVRVIGLHPLDSFPLAVSIRATPRGLG